ncbi:MAG: hypothetical protein ACK4E3_02360 [Brevundimonas sp.]|jgi:hypothetical protein|uniref:hypothetical protein n=1 Tax=Brevundimonas sp. TaxID=1871086 RepID=UPI003919FFF1
MSGPDEFDAYIARLFEQPVSLEGGEAFVRRVEGRLKQSTALRHGLIWAAGLVGGVFAVREAIGGNLAMSLGGAGAGAVRAVETSIETGVQAGTATILSAVPDPVSAAPAVGEAAGVAGVSTGSTGGTGTGEVWRTLLDALSTYAGSDVMMGAQLFWVATALLISVAVVATVRMVADV